MNVRSCLNEPAWSSMAFITASVTSGRVAANVASISAGQLLSERWIKSSFARKGTLCGSSRVIDLSYERGPSLRDALGDLVVHIAEVELDWRDRHSICRPV